MASPNASSIQHFGLNRFPQSHSFGFDANMGVLLPVCWEECAPGTVIDNEVDLFSRSSPLVDPAFLDADISVGHYFVSFEAMDPQYKTRAQDFKGTLENVGTPSVSLWTGNIDDLYTVHGLAASGTKVNIFERGELLDRLGFSVPSVPKSDSNLTFSLNVYPLVAYHMIADWFFRNGRIQNRYRTSQMMKQLFSGLPTSESSIKTSAQFQDAFSAVDNRFQTHFGFGRTYPNALFEFESVNFEPDYFTTARPSASSVEVYLPGTDKNSAPATVHSLLDAELIQKVSDMLYRDGGYSYNDYVRVLFGFDPGEQETENAIYLGGTTRPLQVSTVVQQSVGSDSEPLGTQAGNVSAYISGSNRIRKVCSRGGIYMALAWIRPKVYYATGIDRRFDLKTLGEQIVPQLADASNEPLYQFELNGSLYEFSRQPENRQIFGYMDRYEYFRTRVNRLAGSFVSSRSSWFQTRNFSRLPAQSLTINQEFLNMRNQVNYTPWYVTDSNEPHFFIRAHNDLVVSHLLPLKSHPYAW